MTFEELLELHAEANTPDKLVPCSRRAWLDEPGFTSLYVRIGPAAVAKEVLPKVIQLAAFEVTRKGKGVFTRFVERIESHGLPIFVENVLNERLANYLPKIGFTMIEYKDIGRNLAPCFLKEAS